MCAFVYAVVAHEKGYMRRAEGTVVAQKNRATDTFSGQGGAPCHIYPKCKTMRIITFFYHNYDFLSLFSRIYYDCL